MDPAQYRDAMRAAAEDARDPTEEAIIEEEEEEEEEEDSAAPTGRADEETETETSAGVGFSGDDDAVAGAITAYSRELEGELNTCSESCRLRK